MNSNQKRPISPNQLFNSLMSGNYKQLECQSAMDRIHSQRQILINLIVEYQQEIDRRARQAQQAMHLEGVKARLIEELTRLREDRLQIDQLHIQYQHRQTQLHEDNGKQNQLMAQLVEVRSRNSKIRVRITELAQYILMLEQQNRRLEEERRILKLRAINGNANEINDWRARLDALKHSQQIYDQEIRVRMREREQHSLRMKEEQQNAMRERNRVRMESFTVNSINRQPIDRIRSMGKYRII